MVLLNKCYITVRRINKFHVHACLHFRIEYKKDVKYHVVYLIIGLMKLASFSSIKCRDHTTTSLTFANIASIFICVDNFIKINHSWLCGKSVWNAIFLRLLFCPRVSTYLNRKFVARTRIYSNF